MQTQHMNVTGMTCGGCVTSVTRALKAVAGVGEVDVSLSGAEATVQYDEKLTSPGKLNAAIEGAGYGVAADPPAEEDGKEKYGCCS